jgi:hypothetical protein
MSITVAPSGMVRVVPDETEDEEEISGSESGEIRPLASWTEPFGPAFPLELEAAAASSTARLKSSPLVLCVAGDELTGIVPDMAFGHVAVPLPLIAFPFFSGKAGERENPNRSIFCCAL